MNPTRWLALFLGIVGGLMYADVLRSCENRQLQTVNSVTLGGNGYGERSFGYGVVLEEHLP
jgi:hypothetical protein